jgi:hypothetical protein
MFTSSGAVNETLPSDAVTKKVYALVFNPTLSNGQSLTAYYHWNDPAVLTQQTIDFFKLTSGNRINYTVAYTNVVTNGWPEKIDGFTYTESQYLAVVNRQQASHNPDTVNYNKIVNTPEFDICGKLNRGEIDEVWMFGGPWFGFYESTLVGPGAYFYNSGPVGGPHNCNKLLPIMGMNYERGEDCMLEDFGHRTESTMTKVYGSWQENRTAHNWDRFGLVKAQSPNYSYSGCGSVHYPPNGTSDYNYSNSSTVPSNCNDFANYPNLSDPLLVVQPTTCSLWGCNQIGYFQYWFGHLPVNLGCGPDNVANSWWNYFETPALALNPSNGCQGMSVISGSVGTSGVTISYTDGTLKTATTDSYGNYFLFVPLGWSGTVTPVKAGYSFSPSSRDYVDVQADQVNQDYNKYSISGNAGVAGASISYTGGITTTDSSGNYSFTVLRGWTGTITAAKTGYTFSPVSINITTPVVANLSNQNFTPIVNNYTISGTLDTVGATVSFNGTTSGSASISGSSYSFTVPYGWTGTITPSKTGVNFTPASLTISPPGVTTELPNQNFISAPITYTVSGVLSTTDATVSFSGTTSGSATVSGSSYSFTVPYGWVGAITPSKTGYTFTPSSISISAPGVTTDLPNQNFTSAIGAYIVSGVLGTTGATVTFDGTTYGTATVTDSSYSFTVPYGWVGAITPSKRGYTFTPSSISISAPGVTADLPNQDFASALSTFTVSGALGTTGATVTFNGTTSGSATISGSNYSFTVPYGWTGTITPSKAGYIFTPTSRTISAPGVTADLPNQNFTFVVVTYTISGSLGTKGAGATITYTGGSTTVNSKGNYSFNVPYGWTGSITPSKPGYTFSPTSVSITTPVTSNLPNRNFTVRQSH